MTAIESTLQAIKKKIFLLIGRAIITAIDSSTKTPVIQVTGLKGETITDVEFINPYGFEAIPTEGQAVIVFVNGNRDQGLCLVMHNREERPTDLEDDEVQMYSKFNNYIKCNKDEEVEINGNADYAVAFNDLKTEFNKLKDDYNNHTHVITKVMPGVGSITSELAVPVNTSAIDNAKVETVRLP